MRQDCITIVDQRETELISVVFLGSLSIHLLLLLRGSRRWRLWLKLTMLLGHEESEDLSGHLQIVFRDGQSVLRGVGIHAFRH